MITQQNIEALLEVAVKLYCDFATSYDEGSYPDGIGKRCERIANEQFTRIANEQFARSDDKSHELPCNRYQVIAEDDLKELESVLRSMVSESVEA